jgi:hypothetical protein
MRWIASVTDTVTTREELTTDFVSKPVYFRYSYPQSKAQGGLPSHQTA